MDNIINNLRERLPTWLTDVRARIIGVYVLSFLASQVLMMTVFPYQSSELNIAIKRTLYTIASIPMGAVESLYASVASAGSKSTRAEDKKQSSKTYHMKTMIVTEYTYYVDGKKVIVKVPFGDPRPDQELVENLSR